MGLEQLPPRLFFADLVKTRTTIESELEYNWLFGLNHSLHLGKFADIVLKPLNSKLFKNWWNERSHHLRSANPNNYLAQLNANILDAPSPDRAILMISVSDHKIKYLPPTIQPHIVVDAPTLAEIILDKGHHKRLGQPAAKISHSAKRRDCCISASARFPFSSTTGTAASRSSSTRNTFTRGIDSNSFVTGNHHRRIRNPNTSCR